MNVFTRTREMLGSPFSEIDEEDRIGSLNNRVRRIRTNSYTEALVITPYEEPYRSYDERTFYESFGLGMPVQIQNIEPCVWLASPVEYPVGEGISCYYEPNSWESNNYTFDLYQDNDLSNVVKVNPLFSPRECEFNSVQWFCLDLQKHNWELVLDWVSKAGRTASEQGLPLLKQAVVVNPRNLSVEQDLELISEFGEAGAVVYEYSDDKTFEDALRLLDEEIEEVNNE